MPLANPAARLPVPAQLLRLRDRGDRKISLARGDDGG